MRRATLPYSCKGKVPIANLSNICPWVVHGSTRIGVLVQAYYIQVPWFTDLTVKRGTPGGYTCDRGHEEGPSGEGPS